MKQNWQETSRGGLEFGKSVEIENAGDGSGNEKGLDQGEENLMNVLQFNFDNQAVEKSCKNWQVKKIIQR